MFRLVPLMENLARERVFDELCALLPTVKALDLQRFAPVICGVIPELTPTLHFDQRSPHHAYDLYTHISKVVEQTPPDLILRWAALLHDTGKIATFTTDATGRGHFYGHDKAGAEIADGILRRLKASTALREQVVLLISRHMMRLEPNRKTLRRWLSKLGRQTVDQLLWLQQADMGSKGEADPADDAYFQQIRDVLVELEQEDACLTLKDLAVKGNDLMALGITGRAIGQTLNCLLEKVLEEELPNDKNTLLQFVKDAEK
jgi:tRNA nucleotidyltransferase (CCA-adding enzyme)